MGVVNLVVGAPTISITRFGAGIVDGRSELDPSGLGTWPGAIASILVHELGH